MTEEITNTHAIDLSKIRGDSVTKNISEEEICIKVNNFNLFYGEKQALENINLVIPKKRVTAFIGPSGCGKSTLLRCFNRMNDLIETCKINGNITLDGVNIFDNSLDIVLSLIHI